jgi:hypothetical protein
LAIMPERLKGERVDVVAPEGGEFVGKHCRSLLQKSDRAL